MRLFASAEDMAVLWRPLSESEILRADALLPVIGDLLRVEARRVGVDLDARVEGDEVYASAVKSVVVDVAARALMTSTNQEPMVQTSQSAGGYSASGTFLVPGGGIFIKKGELARLGLRRQRYGVIDFYGKPDTGD